MSSFFVILNLRNLSYLIAPVLGHGFDSRHPMLCLRACLFDSFLFVWYLRKSKF